MTADCNPALASLSRPARSAKKRATPPAAAARRTWVRRYRSCNCRDGATASANRSLFTPHRPSRGEGSQYPGFETSISREPKRNVQGALRVDQVFLVRKADAVGVAYARHVREDDF